MWPILLLPFVAPSPGQVYVTFYGACEGLGNLRWIHVFARIEPARLTLETTVSLPSFFKGLLDIPNSVF